MADMAENSPKPWWESRLDWNLPENLHDTLKMGRNLLRNIPQTMNAYKVGKANALLDQVEPDPVERAKITVTSRKPTAPTPVIPPAPPAPPPKPVTLGVPRAVNMPPAVTKPILTPIPSSKETKSESGKPEPQQKRITLEQLLDPEYTDF